MRTIHCPTQFSAACEQVREAGRSLALVPTMGALHDGHLALVREAAKRADIVVVSIFVNPTQFGPGEDLAKYPTDLERDLAACKAAGVSLVFAPERSEMYLPNESTRVAVPALSASLCGAGRPDHFEGVCTVVSKLFALTGRSLAVFGRKDYQQLKILERMVRDLFLPITIVAHPIVREPDGVAMSSRNRYLSGEERPRACALVQGLARAAIAFEQGERAPATLVGLAQQSLSEAGLVAEYVSLVHKDELTPLSNDVDGSALLAIAAALGGTRLIDNLLLGEDPIPLLSR